MKQGGQKSDQRRFLVFTRFPKEYEPARFMAEAVKLSLETRVISYQSLLPERVNGQKKTAVSAFFDFTPSDIVIFRSAAHFRALPLTRFKRCLMELVVRPAKCLNYHSYAQNLTISKLAGHHLLSRAGIPVIPTSLSAQKSEVARLCRQVGFPLIMKGQYGSHSRRVFRVDTEHEANEVAGKLSGQMLIQPLYESRYYWRALVLGNRVLGIVRRRAHRRFTQAGYTFDVDNTKMMDLSVKATAAYSAEFAGVDLLINPKGGPVVIEVNRSPQFRYFEKVTGVNVAKEVVTYLLHK